MGRSVGQNRKKRKEKERKNKKEKGKVKKGKEINVRRWGGGGGVALSHLLVYLIFC